MTTLKSWWPSILASAVALWGVFGQSLIAMVAAHPRLSSVVAAFGVIIAHLVPSPIAPPAKLN